MTVPALAKALRRQHKRLGTLSPGVIDMLPDSLIVQGFTHCFRCLRRLTPEDVVAKASTVRDFMDSIADARAAHLCTAQEGNEN